MEKQKLKLALLDMNAGQANQGMRCIREISARYKEELDIDEFDVRVTNEVPGTEYDIYISSGGPGNPLEGNGIWEVRFSELIDAVSHNNTIPGKEKKYFFFICHSFQLACAHFELGEICKRRSTSFGIHPVHKTIAGQEDWIFKGLPDPYYAVDSRDWQLIQPNLDVFEEWGATILSLEKLRNHVEYERAIMAVRFSPEMIGTQFHPEADPDGMSNHIQKDKEREKIISIFGKEKFESMVEQLNDEDKISLTNNTILPNFLNFAIKNLKKTPSPIHNDY